MAARGRKRQIEARTPPGPKPSKPDSLSWMGQEIWDKYGDTLNALGLLEVLDAIAFGLLCDAIATLHDMRDEFARDGSFTNVCGENGALQANPLVTMIAQQTKGVLQLAAEFGMTPRGRINLTGSLSCNPDAGAVNPMEALLKEVTASGQPSASSAVAPQTETKALAKVPKKGTPKGKAAKKGPKRK